jgi:hypothetical protein
LFSALGRPRRRCGSGGGSLWIRRDPAADTITPPVQIKGVALRNLQLKVALSLHFLLFNDRIVTEM